MFFNNPPLFSATEFTFDLPAEDKGIDISDLDTWHEWVQNEKKFQRPPPLNEFLHLLLSDSWVGVTDPRFEHLSIFALLCEFAKILILTLMSDTGGIARESMIPVHELLRHPSNRTI
ncbi:hypothetical protein F1880_006679 [Penicillium rolfsii]|nr:hypothetical protein F1880_006679 [Penicillium rolfsii]